MKYQIVINLLSVLSRMDKNFTWIMSNDFFSASIKIIFINKQFS